VRMIKIGSTMTTGQAGRAEKTLIPALREL
jgi:hypothetical protein